MVLALLNLLRDVVFAEKFESDVREDSFAVVDIPLVGGKFGLIGFEPLFWLQLITLVTVQSIVNVTVALVIFEFIVSQSGKKNWLVRNMVGYGVVCPLLVAFPFALIDYMELRNKAMMLAGAASCCLLFFRCIEAINEGVPEFAKRNRSSFVLYYASTINFSFDPKLDKVERADRSEILRKSTLVGSLFLQATLAFSILYPIYEIVPIPEGNVLTGMGAVAHMINNFALASLTSICLEVGSTANGLGVSLMSGLKTVDVNDNPLSKSQSPSEFWNKRWNTLVSHGLKRGVFVPLRRAGFSKPFAALATFVSSGLMHEYLLLIINFNEIKETGTISFSGAHLAFFAWNGVVLGAEHYCKDWSIIHWISNNFPRPIKTALVICTVLPLAHLFTQEYVDSGFYSSLGIGFPRIEYYGS
mmetsp:Transcript_10122/g.13375  ORF Transcript_10122/g.13375 Transcript_10122/m.13375 type:complete len:415 (-) Transcript_10122:151-1395(-)